jgi:hypothetical protein
LNEAFLENGVVIVDEPREEGIFEYDRELL